MEFLKPVFGAEKLSYDEFCGRLATAGRDVGAAKLADLSQGGYVAADKLRRVVAQRGEMAEKLAACEARLAAFDGVDVDALAAQAEDARQAAARAAADAEADLALVRTEMQRQLAAEKAAGGLAFTSQSARDTFIAGLCAAPCPIGKEGGFSAEDTEAFRQAFAQRDPGALADAAPPAFSCGAQAAPASWRERLAENFLRAKI